MTTVAIIILVGLGYFKGMGIYSGSKKVELGLKDESLAMCSNKPNCVSTSNTDEKHTISPIKTNLEFAQIIEKLKGSGLKLIKSESNYAHFTYTSSIMGYVDDIEILLKAGELSIRSASRVGYSDLGANRKRVENLRSILK